MTVTLSLLPRASGGMSLGTLLTLFVIPAVYSYFGRSVVTERAAHEALPAPAE